MDKKQAYEVFWEQLLPAYPVSKGSMRLPIATTLSSLPNFSLEKILQELEHIVTGVLKNHGTQAAAVARANTAGESLISPLITDEYTGVIRFDCIWNPVTDSVKVLEMNCDYPDGLILHDKTISILSGEEISLHTSLLQKLFSPNEPVTTFYDKNAGFLDGYYAEHNSLQKSQPETNITHEAHNIAPHHSLRRCLEVTKFTPELISHLQRHKTRVVNTLALRTLGYKTLLETIKHPFVPETFSLSPNTKHRCQQNKDQWVLKPSDGCEGYGIHIGNQVTPEEWERLVEKHLTDNYVVQEYVSIPKTTVELYDNETVIKKEAYFDLCPHVFIKDGKIIGRGHTLMRYSENPVVNVMQGGGIGYYKP